MIAWLEYVITEAARTFVGTAMIWPLNEYLLKKIFSTAWRLMVG